MAAAGSTEIRPRTGRVIGVTARSDGRFGVTIGPAPDMYWFAAKKPPRLGERVEVTGYVLRREVVDVAGTSATISVLDGAEFRVLDEPYAVREVDEKWGQAVSESMRRPLYRYQIQGGAWLAARLHHGQSSILSDDPGLGKTAQAISAVVTLRLFPCLVVCPATLKEQWERELSYSAYAPSVSIIEGWMSSFQMAEVLVLNYDLLRTRMVQLVRLGLQCVIFDEMQALKCPAPRSRQHRARLGTELAHRVGKVIGLTGTPIMNDTSELWRLLHICDPKAWPSYSEFWKRHGKKPKKASARKVKNLDELHVRAAPFILRRQKHQVLADLPRKSRNSVLVRIEGAELEHYRAAEKDVVKWLRALGEKGRANNASRAVGVVKLTMLRRIAALGKMARAVPQYVYSWFARAGAAPPLVIFGYHKDVMTKLWHLCTTLGLRVSGIGGLEARRHRQAQVDVFQAGGADVFLAPIMAAGVGINLHRAADALFIERVWSYSQQVQAEDRIHRLGQDRPVTITYLDAVGTVDQYLQEILAAKEKVITDVVDGLVGHEHETLQVASEVAELMVSK